MYPRPSFRQLIRADAAALGGGPRSKLFYAAAALGLSKFSAVFLYRLSAYFAGGGRVARVLSAAAYRMNAMINACEISPQARIGPGLYLPHPIGIVLGPVHAGSGLTLLQNVTIGLRDRTHPHDDPASYPHLGARVQVGPGAVLMGPISIGDDVMIGANAVVLDDVPTGSVAFGAKANHRLKEFTGERQGVERVASAQPEGRD